MESFAIHLILSPFFFFFSDCCSQVFLRYMRQMFCPTLLWLALLRNRLQITKITIMEGGVLLQEQFFVSISVVSEFLTTRTVMPVMHTCTLHT